MMECRDISRPGAVWAGIAFVVWLIINIRVEAGVGTPFERAVDGLVGGAVLLVAVFISLRFFQCGGQDCGDGKSCSRK